MCRKCQNNQATQLVENFKTFLFYKAENEKCKTLGIS